jgi:hypothetical protein
MQVDVLKLISIAEEGLMTQAKLQKRHDESDAKAFARVYESDITYRRQWQALTDARHLQALKGMATLTPTSTVVESGSVKDGSAEAVRLLQEMAEKQHKKFEDVFSAPENRELAARTYRSAHRSSM